MYLFILRASYAKTPSVPAQSNDRLSKRWFGVVALHSAPRITVIFESRLKLAGSRPASPFRRLTVREFEGAGKAETRDAALSV